MYNKNYVHYVVATVIMVRDGKFLIAKRADWEKGFPGKWTVPGGKLEVTDYTQRPKDTSAHWYGVLEDVLRREIREETRLEIKDIGYVTSLVYIRDDNVPTLIVSLYANYARGEVTLSNELTEHAWITLEEAENYDLIAGIYEEIEMLDRHLKGKNMGEWNKTNS